jgi:hypothetical protein
MLKYLLRLEPEMNPHLNSHRTHTDSNISPPLQKGACHFMTVTQAIMLWFLLCALVCLVVDAGKSVSVGLFVQVGNMHKLDDMIGCVSSVTEAKNILVHKPEKRLVLENPSVSSIMLDVYVSYVVHQKQTNITQYETIAAKLKSFGSLIDNYYISSSSQGSRDAGQFLNQMKLSEANQKQYDVVLKVHSKGHKEWAEYSTQCLCGTHSHVMSILNQFVQKPEVEMIVPQGLLFSTETPKAHLHPALVQMYFKQTDLAAAFGPANVETIESLYKAIFNAPLSVPTNKLLCGTGTMFWARYQSLRPKEVTAALPLLTERWSKGSVRDSGIEHALERLIPTWVVKHGGTIAQMIAAPKAVALYFPQYHAIPENDRFHGEGFTEWTLLKPLKDYPSLMKPLPEEEGGLGYYNLTEKRVRQRQAELATVAGVHGFVYYHYWFSGPKAPENHLVMHKIPQLMLQDGQPSKPFMLSWANEPWTRTWVGLEEDILLSQEYGGRDDWIVHFYYLLKFFRHPRYIRVHDKPAFAIYRIGHIGDKLQPILSLWNELAIENGLLGIHFINTIGNFVKRDANTFRIWRNSPEIEGAFHFRPQLRDPFNQEYSTASLNDVPLPIKTTQYWGAFTNFDARPRRPTAEAVRPDLTPALFHSELVASFRAMTTQPSRFVSPNLYFLTAWNEWNEQAVLEPDQKNGFGHLLALKGALETVECTLFPA